jgi:hypothetical protein
LKNAHNNASELNRGFSDTLWRERERGREREMEREREGELERGREIERE